MVNQVSKMFMVVAGISLLGMSGVGCVEGMEPTDSEEDVFIVAKKHKKKHKAKAKVYDFGTSDIIPGKAKLTRSNKGHKLKYKGKGYTPGHVVTMWYVPFDYPENCSNGGTYDGLNDCGVPDIGNPATGASMLYAGGGIADENGELTLKDFVGLGEDGAPGEIFRGTGLHNIYGSEVHLVPRTHGPPIDDCFEEQITTFGGCCDQFACENLQAAIFPPVY